MIAAHHASIRWLARLALPLLLLAACSVDPKANERYMNPCSKSEQYRGYCEEKNANVGPPPDSGTANGDGSATGSGGDGSSGNGSGGNGGDGGMTGEDLTGKSCAGATMAAYCYLGPKNTDGTGICHGGHRDCVNGKWTECLGEVRPEEETCNGVDDDCDGDKDDDIAPEACDGCGTYECTNGHKVCRKGEGAVPHEICNGKDDDCDGHTDENADTPCADGNAGCDDQGGVITCKGICQAGMKTCKDGKLASTCEGQITPNSKDGCNNMGFGLDDDCDGAINEDCTCDPNTSAPLPCYGGPADTLDGGGNPKGECKKGTQTCGSDGKYGACKGEQRPKDEDCTNMEQDDDCDGTMDEDIPGFGDACPTSESGQCKTGAKQCKDGALQCVAPPMMDEVCNKLDDNCDGYIDEPFDLSSDEDNCGTCGKKCDSAQQCCAGSCTNTTSDPKNCGGCNMPCGNGVSCCPNGCFDLKNTKANCGTCGHACPGSEVCCAGQCASINLVGICVPSGH